MVLINIFQNKPQPIYEGRSIVKKERKEGGKKRGVSWLCKCCPELQDVGGACRVRDYRAAPSEGWGLDTLLSKRPVPPSPPPNLPGKVPHLYPKGLLSWKFQHFINIGWEWVKLPVGAKSSCSSEEEVTETDLTHLDRLGNGSALLPEARLHFPQGSLTMEPHRGAEQVSSLEALTVNKEAEEGILIIHRAKLMRRQMPTWEHGDSVLCSCKWISCNHAWVKIVQAAVWGRHYGKLL